MAIRNKIIVGALGVSLVAGVPAAYAQAPTGPGYSTPGGVVQTQLTPTQPHSTPSPTTEPAANVTPSQPASTVQATRAQKLPFTGLDLALVVGAGCALMALGFGLRRLTRQGDVA